MKIVDKFKNMSDKKKRKTVVWSTVAGVIVLFLTIVFFPADMGSKTVAEVDGVESETVDESKLSRTELEELVKQLEKENNELKTEVEKYKILAEQKTDSVSAPVVTTSGNKKEEVTEYKDSSQYYDENYKDYTDDDIDEETEGGDTATDGDGTDDESTGDDKKNDNVSEDKTEDKTNQSEEDKKPSSSTTVDTSKDTGTTAPSETDETSSTDKETPPLESSSSNSPNTSDIGL